MPLRRTQVLCTIGPASIGRVPELLRAGMDVARINLSHGTRAEHVEAAGPPSIEHDRLNGNTGRPGTRHASAAHVAFPEALASI